MEGRAVVKGGPDDQKRTALLAFAAVFAIIAGACGDSSEPSTQGGPTTLGVAGGTVASTRPAADFDPTAILRYGSMQANSLDPVLQKTPCEVTQMRLLYDTLFSYDSSGKLQPMLATEYKLDDPLNLTVKLRTNVKFQDGTPFNAEAIKLRHRSGTHRPDVEHQARSSCWTR